jgi:hypothetical protein
MGGLQRYPSLAAAPQKSRHDARHRLPDMPDGQISDMPVHPWLQKYFGSRLTQITSITLASRPKRGAFRDRHGRWARDAVDVSGAADESADLRTEKSSRKTCGEIVDSHYDVIARSEATKQSTLSCYDMDCFASLAMTAEFTSQIVDLPLPHPHVREDVAMIRCSDPVSVPALIFHDHAGADGDAIVQILYVFIGHASKRRLTCISDRA